jgi:hypothetical protein
MPVTPTGRLALPLQYLKNLVAGSTTFQELVGAANAAAAKGKIYLGTVLEDDSNLSPRCQLRLDNGDIAERVGTTSWRGAGPIEMLFILAHPEGVEDPNDAYTTILNQLGAIIAEMFALATTDPGAGPYLNITGITRSYIGQWDQTFDGTDQYWDGEFSVQWEGM